jgi:hypothetical protein
MKEQQVPPLRSPGFPVDVGGVGKLHAASLLKAAQVVAGGCRVAGNPGSSGRDDNSFCLLFIEF